MKSVKQIVQMRCRLDNQVLAAQSKTGDEKREDLKNAAILYKRMSSNLSETLMPMLYANDEKDGDV
jgi:hypothetical protein